MEKASFQWIIVELDRDDYSFLARYQCTMLAYEVMIVTSHTAELQDMLKVHSG